MYANGAYVIVVQASDASHTVEGYSNDFTIVNIIFQEPLGSFDTENSDDELRNRGRRCCMFLYNATNTTLDTVITDDTVNDTNDTIEINESVQTMITSPGSFGNTATSSDVTVPGLQMQQPPAPGLTDIQAPPTHNISQALAPERWLF